MSEITRYLPATRVDNKAIMCIYSPCSDDDGYVKYTDYLSQITTLNQTIKELREGLIEIRDYDWFCQLNEKLELIYKKDDYLLALKNRINQVRLRARDLLAKLDKKEPDFVAGRDGFCE